MNLEQKIGRRLRLRDLQFVFSVAEHGSMAKAASHLGVTQSAVSQTIADIETSLGVLLFDRSRRGVELTSYGSVLVARGKAAFAELRQALQEIDYLRNEGSGEIRIGCPETLTASVLPIAIRRFSQRWPQVALHVDTITGAAAAAKLRDRSIDLVFARGGPGLDDLEASDDFAITKLFEDKLSIVVGANSRWARLRHIGLSDLRDAPWIMIPYGWGKDLVPAAFELADLPPPRVALHTFSIHLRLHLVSTGQFVTALPDTVLNLHRKPFALKRLSIELPRNPYGVAIATLKNRTLSRVAELFIQSALDEFKSTSKRNRGLSICKE